MRAARLVLSRRAASDYYSLLGVERSASAADIKRSYYALSKKLHPDHNKNDSQAAQRFAEVSQAYAVLSEEESKRAYDRTLSTSGGSTIFTNTGGNSSSGHMRNQRQSGPLDYNTHYDFQEFYKRHYDDAAHRERVRRARLAEYEKQMKEASRGNSMMLISVVLMTAAVLAHLTGD